MSPTFLLSFDCEGKWGFADGLSAHYRHYLGHEPLTGIYQRLLDTLERYRVRASFAFVGALTLSPEQAAAHPDWFVDVPVGGQSWLARFREDWQRRDTEGWFEPELLQLVRAHPQHEIASHGFTHLPLGESLVNRRAVQRELETAQAAARLHDLRLRTLVYPRNLCGYLAELPRFGFLGYRRGGSQPPHRLRRLGNLLAECWPRLRAEAGAAGTRPVAIPAGHLLNWRHGPRRHIPLTLTRRRWRYALDDALRHGGVVHLWAHPHNFLDGDRQLQLLERVLALVAERGKDGLTNPTLAEYCRLRLAGTRP